MREILFRARWISPIWLYGYCFLDFDNRWVMRWNEDDKALVSIIYPETICEYTGITDKSGNKVFEGDILHIEKENFHGVVRYGRYCNPFNDDPDRRHVGFYVEWNDRPELLRRDLAFWCSKCEVVGNIFDNPELIKGEVW